MPMTPAQIEAKIESDPAIQEFGYRLRQRALERPGDLAPGEVDREVMRAMIYVAAKGFGALDSSDCVVFKQPSCKDGWNCLNPEHQLVGA